MSLTTLLCRSTRPPSWRSWLRSRSRSPDSSSATSPSGAGPTRSRTRPQRIQPVEHRGARRAGTHRVRRSHDHPDVWGGHRQQDRQRRSHDPRQQRHPFRVDALRHDPELAGERHHRRQVDRATPAPGSRAADRSSSSTRRSPNPTGRRRGNLRHELLHVAVLRARRPLAVDSATATARSTTSTSSPTRSRDRAHGRLHHQRQLRRSDGARAQHVPVRADRFRTERRRVARPTSGSSATSPPSRTRP